MSKKLSNTKLLGILVILIAAIAIVKVLDSRKGERNFRSELVDIDTTKVTSVLIYPKSKKDKEVDLYKEGDQWKVKVSDAKSLPVGNEKITNLFTQLLNLKPKRLAAKSKDRWKDFEVDTSGTKVIVKAGDKKVLDIILGKFSYQQTARSMETYVRLANDDETYTVEGFLDATFNQGVDAWRDKTIIKGKKDEWTSLSFTLPDSSYNLQKMDSVWEVGSQIADASKVDQYLNSITNVNGTTYADDVDPNTLGSPDYTLVILNQQGDQITVNGFVKNGRELMRSSLNKESLFDAKAGNLFEKIFVSQQKFFSEGS